MPDDEQFDRVDAVMRKHASEEPGGSYMPFNTLVVGIANRFIARRRRHLWGLIPDSRYKSFVADVHIGSDEPWRLRVWPVQGQKNLYVDHTKRLVERTVSGEFRRVGFEDFTPARRVRIMESMRTALKFNMI